MSSARLHVAAAVLVTLAGCGDAAPRTPPSHSAATPASAPASAPAAPPLSDSLSSFPRDLPPRPRVPFAPARPMPVVEAVFAFAAQHPEVLSRMPCFCGCENRGHRHNDDCFVAARDERGRVTQWEPHGMG